jgi:hypothetical protein
VPVGLLRDAWKAGRTSRLTVFLGLSISVAWASFVAVVAVRFVLDTIREPALAAVYTVPLLVVFAVIVLFLVIPLPAQWLMYALLRLDQRRRRASGSKS